MKAEKVISDCVDIALSNCELVNKPLFLIILRDRYGLNSNEIGEKYELFHQALSETFGLRHFTIERLIAKTIHLYCKEGHCGHHEEIQAFNHVFSIYKKEVEQKLGKQEKEFSLQKHAQNLQLEVNRIHAELKTAERMAAIGETAAMVGHDIRNPLQAMVSDVYLLRSTLESMPQGPDKEDAMESLSGLENNIAYINKIVSDLQDYARPLKPEYSNVDLNILISDVLKNMKLPGNIKVVTETSKAPPQIKTEATFLRRALTNLINNSIQAMPDGGKLEIKGFLNGGHLSIIVSDNGVGIAKEVKPKLFKPMVTTKSKGQGFGLAVVKRLIEALNGTITFESEEGKGTKFIIKLPL